jgi:FixJ family two-component response regulator
MALCHGTPALCLVESRLQANPLISVIDDDEDVLVSITSLMESLGFQIEAFSSGPDFLSSRAIRQTDCLIADVQMPRMTGIEVHRHLVQSGHAIPTILITAYFDDSMRDRALAQGVTCYLRKPINEHGLLRCIRSALERSEADRDPS